MKFFAMLGESSISYTISRGNMNVLELSEKPYEKKLSVTYAKCVEWVDTVELGFKDLFDNTNTDYKIFDSTNTEYKSFLTLQQNLFKLG
jgi:hypothetical protein